MSEPRWGENTSRKVQCGPETEVLTASEAWHRQEGARAFPAQTPA